MKKVLFGILILLVAGLVGTAVAYAGTVNRSPDATFPHSSELNKVDYWGENCTKYEEGFDGSVGHMPAGYSLLVLKAGTENFVWFNPPAGDYGTPSFQDISHSIVCRGEVYEPCSETTDWIEQARIFIRELPNGDKIFSIPFLKFDAHDETLVCSRRAQIVFERYKVCTQQTDWIFFSTTTETKPNGTVVTKHVYFKYDFYDQETVCDTRVAVERIPYEACSTVTDWQFSETILVRTKPDGTDIYSDVYLKYDLQGGAVCARRAQIRIVPPETCEVTTTIYGDWSGWFYDLIVRLLKRTRTVTLVDFTDKVTVCGRSIEVQFDDYSPCESENVTVGEWSDWAGSGIDKTSYRETIDNNTGEVCNTEYRKECFGEESVHFWTDGWCMFRDRTYPENASWMVNPPVFAQNAYCGCGYVPFGEWGIVEVSECDGDGYKYWNEITPYCGYENCE